MSDVPTRVAHAEDHHPGLELSCRRHTLNGGAHPLDGLAANDCNCAAPGDALLGHDA